MCVYPQTFFNYLNLYPSAIVDALNVPCVNYVLVISVSGLHTHANNRTMYTQADFYDPDCPSPPPPSRRLLS